MDYGTKATLRSGIVDRNRYANDPIYRETIRRHNPMVSQHGSSNLTRSITPKTAPSSLSFW